MSERPRAQPSRATVQAASIALVAAIVVGIALVYAAAPTYGFLGWDDRVHTIENPHLPDTAYFWGHFEQGMYMPLTFSFWSLLYRAFGPSRAAFHGINVVCHVANALLVFALLRELLAVGEDRAHAARSARARGRRAEGAYRDVLGAGAGALLFALHPLQVETVSWITSLKDLGCALGGLGALWGYVRVVRGGLGQRHWLYVGSVVAFFGATLAKPAALVVVLLLAALSLLWLEVPWRRALGLLLPFALAAVPSAVCNSVSQGRLTLLYSTPLYLRPLVALDSLGFYLGKVIWPMELLPAYERSPRWLIESGTIAWSWIPGALALGLAWLARRRAPRPFAAFVLFVLALALVLGLLTFAAQDNSTVYDHYVYLALLGPALMAGLAVRHAPARWHLGLAALVLVALGAKSAVQTRYWRDDETLWSFAVARSPQSAVALVALGLVYSQRGERERALELYERAVRAKPHDVEAHHNLGAMLASLGRRAEARAHFERAAELNPREVAARNHLARIHFEAGELDEAERYVRAVLERAPRHPDANIRLGEILLARGALGECVRHMSEVVAGRPHDPDALTLLGVALAQRGEVVRAIPLFERALAVAPDHASARRNLAVATEQLRRPTPATAPVP